MYNYYDAMRNDLIDWICDNYNLSELLEALEDTDDLREKMEDACWINDGVTGNASGSYTFNSYKAQQYVTCNMDLCMEALREFCTDAETIAERFLNEDWEYFDVTIRCYILPSAVYEMVEALEACKDAIAAQTAIDADSLSELLTA